MSIWDAFSRAPKCTLNGDTGNIACDSYHQYTEDIKLLQSLGVIIIYFYHNCIRIYKSVCIYININDTVLRIIYMCFITLAIIRILTDSRHEKQKSVV